MVSNWFFYSLSSLNSSPSKTRTEELAAMSKDSWTDESVKALVTKSVIITAIITFTVSIFVFMLIRYFINRKTHNVFFGDYQVVTVGHNRIVPLPKPEKEGYEFCGWYQDEELTTKWFPTNVVLQDTYLFPKWEPKE